MKKYIIIVAGGRGVRMDSELPKQFIILSGKPIILHTVLLFQRFDPRIETIIAIHPDYQDYWKRLLDEYKFNFKHILVTGGSERFHSVKNALDHVLDEGIIAVHDSVRPLVSPGTVQRSFAMAEEKGTAVPCLAIPETVRSIDPDGSKAIARDSLRIIQTPQVFHSQILKESYQTDYLEEFTDDASVVEKAGHTIHLVEGNIENIKITTKEDLKLAEFYLGQ
jgi:2-C-methyl-D-erythritol 4-phosphate cytidylyltransferase